MSVTEQHQQLEQSKPAAADFDSVEEFEEALGYWMSHVARILALTGRDPHSAHRPSQLRLKTGPVAGDMSNWPWTRHSQRSTFAPSTAVAGSWRRKQ
jgi:hypothetical protein